MRLGGRLGLQEVWLTSVVVTVYSHRWPSPGGEGGGPRVSPGESQTRGREAGSSRWGSPGAGS